MTSLLRRIVALIVAAYAFATPVAAASLDAPPTVPHETPQLREGRELYGVRCSSCHGTHFYGSPVAPPLLGVGAATVDFWLGTGRMPAMVPQNIQAMHATPQFTQTQIDALVAYITTASPGGPAIPRVENVGGGHDLARGRSIYAANCQACHGAMGQGGAVGYGYIAPALYEASVTQVAEAIRTGPGPMPRFGPSVISQSDLDAVVRYVNHLQTQAIHPGGFNLANIGPVAEGLVSWVLGLGVLIGVIRLIGSNT